MSKQEEKRKLLMYAWNYCDVNDKSTEFMIQYMKDVAEVDDDYVLDFIQKTTWEERYEFAKSENKRLKLLKDE